MKFTTNRDALLKAITVAQDIITNKSPVSILSNVLLQTAENKVIVKCTNSTVKVVTSFGAEIEEEGELTVYCDKFMSIINSLPMGDVEVSSKENEVIVQPIGKKVKFRIKSLAADKFPIINGFMADQVTELSAKDLKNLIRNTIFAVSSDQNRYIMTGCYVCKVDNLLTMVATDGRRMSVCNCVDFSPDFTPAIIPTKMLSVLEKFCSDEGNVQMVTTDKTFSVKAGNLEVSTALIEGQYPMWQKVLPSGLDHSVTVSKKELEDALKCACIMVQKNGRVQMVIDKERLEISSPDTEMGSSKQEIAAVYDGEPVNIALNALYLSDILKVITAESITIDFTLNEDKKVSKALIVRESGEAKTSYTHVIMPMTF